MTTNLSHTDLMSVTYNSIINTINMDCVILNKSVQTCFCLFMLKGVYRPPVPSRQLNEAFP